MNKLKLLASHFRCIIEDNLISAPYIFHKNVYGADSVSMNAKLAELRSRGYTSIEGLLTPKELIAIRENIDKVTYHGSKNIQASWNDKVKYWSIKNPLCFESSLIKCALNSMCLGVAERYFRRKPYLADVDMRRIPPVDMENIQSGGYSSSNWHRDTRGRQLKMMIYLTDVTESDSNFSFIPESHIGAFRRKYDFMSSRFSDAEVCNKNKSPIEWYGKAGSAMLFDTNLIHRLRRKPASKVRDTITFYYTPGQNTRHLMIDGLDLKKEHALSEALDNPSWPFSVRT